MRRFIKENSSVILALTASGGVIGTAYFTGKASFRAAHVLESEDPYEDLRTKAGRVWKLYIPAGTCAVGTIICIVGVKRIDGKKTLAAQTALAVTQAAYSEYRDKVIEEFGEKKDKYLLSKVAESKVQSNPPNTSLVIGSGKVLCCELFTGRYFESDMEALNKAVNEINARILRHDYATLDDLYYILGLQTTMSSGQCGWESPRLLELEFSSILSPDGRPCLAFEYGYVKSF